MEIKVEGKNKKYASLLLDCFNGKFSDFTTFLLFKYEYIMFSKIDNSFSINMNKISNDSLSHLEIVGKLINLLGEKITFIPNPIINKIFLYDKTTLLELNIRLTKEKIILYTKNLELIEDKYIHDILENFIIEERKNLKILEILQLKNKIKKI